MDACAVLCNVKHDRDAVWHDVELVVPQLWQSLLLHLCLIIHACGVDHMIGMTVALAVMHACRVH